MTFPSSAAPLGELGGNQEGHPAVFDPHKWEEGRRLRLKSDSEDGHRDDDVCLSG